MGCASNVLFSSVIAFGVVYNAARISLSERSRELAVMLLIAVPAGLLLGYGLAALTVRAFDTELYRFPQLTCCVRADTKAFTRTPWIAKLSGGESPEVVAESAS